MLGAIGWGLAHRGGDQDVQISSSFVILPNGAPFGAPLGSSERELIDWLSGQGTGERYVDLGSPQFEPRSIAPTPVFRRRVERLASILTAFDNIDIRVIGRTPKERNVADASLTGDRIDWVTASMRGADVPRSRLSADIIDVAASQSQTPKADETGQLTLLLRRRD